MKTPNGYRNIEDIHAGDKVLSYNEKTKRLEVQTVAQTFIRKTDRIYTLVYDTGTKLQTTATHPFYIEGKGWVKAADLHIGDDSLLAGEVSPLDIYGGARLQNVSYRQSKQGVIVNITVEERHETVYNFEVNETHTYLVGESDVVVHNAQEYAVKTGEMRFRVDANQRDFVELNKKEAELKAKGLLTPEKKAELRRELEARLKSRAQDMLSDQRDYFMQNCMIACEVRWEYLNGQQITDRAADFVSMKLRQFDEPIIGSDFFNNEPVKVLGMKSLDQMKNTKGMDITKAVDQRVANAEKLLVPGGGRMFNAGQFWDLFRQGGTLDFKNAPELGASSAALDGYQNYRIYNDKIVHMSDIGNVVFGDFSKRYLNAPLGQPDGPPTNPKNPSIQPTIYGMGHYYQLNDWGERDRPTDQKAMAYGYRCGSKVGSCR